MLAPQDRTWPPDYVAKFAWRQDKKLLLEKQPHLVKGALAYYRTRPAEWISDWCDTYDPRNAGQGLPAHIPFILFRRQRELCDFLLLCLENEENGLVEKCRDMGATYVCVCFSVWLWLFWPGVSVGWGSRKADLVDRIGDPDSIFEKMRIVINRLPRFFLPRGFDPDSHMAYMRITNPATNASITGESGNNIGRGGRKRIYFKDESAHYEQPEMIEAALTDNTRVAIDISSVSQPNNIFHRKRESGADWEPGQKIVKGRTQVFVMAWEDHPAKTEEWYESRRRKAEIEGLQHVFAQEVDRNYYSAVEGVIIKPEWVLAAVDAHVKLKIPITGGRCASLDVADGGTDTNAMSVRKGILLESLNEWGERDVGVTTRRAVSACASLGPIELQYDCVGLGAAVKAESNRLADEDVLPPNVKLVPWNAGAKVLNPRARVVPDDDKSPLNEDFYYNLKAQAWWEVARRFERTYRAVHEKNFTYDPDDLISIPSTLPLKQKLTKELCQVTVTKNSRLKLLIDKTPDGAKSPNLGDSFVMCYWPVKPFEPPRAAFGVQG